MKLISFFDYRTLSVLIGWLEGFLFLFQPWVYFLTYSGWVGWYCCCRQNKEFLGKLTFEGETLFIMILRILSIFGGNQGEFAPFYSLGRTSFQEIGFVRMYTRAFNEKRSDPLILISISDGIVGGYQYSGKTCGY